MRTNDDAGPEILDPSECFQLLCSVPVGRLVLTQGGLPVVRPVAFFVDGDTIVFASGDSDWLRAAHRGDVVAFEVDEVDLEQRRGWTVTSIGHLSIVPAAEAAGLARSAPPWLRLRDRQLIRLGTESVTGRRAH